MSQSVIGALRVNLGLDSAKFEKGARRVQTPLARMKSQFKAVAGVAALAGAAISAAALAGARDIDKVAKSARRLDSSIGGFRALELAADEAGVSLSSLTSDLQTMDREIASIGVSGNGQRALDALGLSVDDLAGKDADEKLATIADKVKELGLTSGQTTAILRDLGVRNREMVLLVGQGGDAIRAARKDIEDYGLATSQVDSDRIEAANDAISRLGLIGQFAGQQLAIALVPAMGQLATSMTDSLRAGGVLRAVIEGLTDNIERLGTYLAVAVTGFGVRFVGALVVAKVATFTLAGAMLALRRAIMLTGIGLAVIAAGELVLWFNKLVGVTGGWGAALTALGELASGVWQGIKTSASSIGPSLGAVWQTVKAGFFGMLDKIAQAWSTFLGNMAGGLSGVPGMGAAVDALSAAAGRATDKMGEFNAVAASAEAASSRLKAEAASLATEGWDKVGASLKVLNDLTDSATADMSDGATAADGLADALDGVSSSSDGGGGGGGAARSIDNIKTAVSGLGEGLKSVKSTAKSTFASFVTGAKSGREALSDLLNSFATMLANQAFDSLFSGGGFLGGIFKGLIPGFASGTNFAPGGIAMVGERGPELVNLPRGSQVIPNNKLSGSIGGGTSVVRVELGEGLVGGILQQSGEQSLVISQGVVDGFAKNELPSHVNKISKDPRRIG